jgi:hypothetical protein
VRQVLASRRAIERAFRDHPAGWTDLCSFSWDFRPVPGLARALRRARPRLRDGGRPRLEDDGWRGV